MLKPARCRLAVAARPSFYSFVNHNPPSIRANALVFQEPGLHEYY